MKLLAAPTLFFLCLAALAFPFSVAVTNAALGGALGLSILSGLWWQGARQCWQHYRSLSIAFCAYFFLMLLGLAWSADRVGGLHVLGRQWFWLLVPGIAAVSARENWRRWFLASLSTGLAVNLVYCVLQMFGYVNPGADGSSPNDATGHIGHIGFGMVYGVWAAWLVHLGLSWSGKRRWAAWGLAAWSYAMIFSAQGRSGYLIAVVLMVIVCLKWIIRTKDWRYALPVVGMALLVLVVIMLGPGKVRLQGTWLAMTQTHHERILKPSHGDDFAIPATRQRFFMWKTTLDIYRENPVLGIGTGGLRKAVGDMKAEGRLSSPFASIFTQPHNQYLLALVRWGPVGLVSLLSLLILWMREGWTRDWWESSMPLLVFLPALGLAIHALSSSSLEEHFTSVLAALLLGTGISMCRDTKCLRYGD